MKITFLGAAKTVTGSCYLIESEAGRLLVDCGMFQGYSKENALNEEPFPFNPADLDFVLLTHAHIDHSGRIPKLFLDGYKGEVIATKATAELCSIMLPDSGHIQEFENEWENRKRLRAGKPPVQPLYTHQDALDCIKFFHGVKYDEIITLKDSIRVRFNDAGHVLGSSILEIWVQEEGRETKVVFSGDLGNKGMPILRDPSIIKEADYLVIESTYGNRLHQNKESKIDKFLNIILETVEKGGNVVIPSFAVGRTQEIIYELNKQREKYGDKYDALMGVPVYVDSPLAVSATEIFRRNLDCYDEEARGYIENGNNPLDFPGLKFTASADESRELNEKKESMIIISASGMCEAGRVKHHLKHNLWRKESVILFVGYQAEGTLGRRILDGARRVKIFGEDITVNAKIEMIEGFSGHADRDGLLEWIQGFEIKPRNIFIVHGEENNMVEFSKSILDSFSIESFIPSRGESYIIEPDGAYLSSTDKEKIKVKQRFTRLELLDYLDKLKEELDEMSEIVKNDLKREKDDREVEKIKTRLRSLEESIVEVLK